LATQGERLYNAIQAGEIDPARLNAEGKSLLKSYLDQKTKPAPVADLRKLEEKSGAYKPQPPSPAKLRQIEEQKPMAPVIKPSPFLSPATQQRIAQATQAIPQPIKTAGAFIQRVGETIADIPLGAPRTEYGYQYTPLPTPGLERGAEFTGEVAGLAYPYGRAYKVFETASKVIPAVQKLSPIAQRLGTVGISGAAAETGLGVVESAPPKEIAKRAALVGALGAGAELIGPGVKVAAKQIKGAGEAAQLPKIRELGAVKQAVPEAKPRSGVLLAETIPAPGKTVEQARTEIKTMQDAFKVQDTPQGSVNLYSGIPIEEIQTAASKAAKNLRDNLGMAEEGVKIIAKQEAKQPSIGSVFKSPLRVAEKYPQLKPYVQAAARATVHQEKLRNVFNRRLEAVDKVLSRGGRAAYKVNKALYQEILLAGDVAGKQFTMDELRTLFNANDDVIRAYNLTRSAYDHAYSIANAARALRGKDPIAYRQGYIPHFFHNYFIIVDDEIIGSAKTLREAVNMSNPLAREGRKITIRPKQFEYPGEAAQAAVLGDRTYFKFKGEVEKQFDLTADEAQQLLEGVARLKGRSRFVGNFMQRKGVKGWETNLDWVNRHYFNMMSRYAALDRFKAGSISRFERQFGAFDKEHKGIAGYIKKYINDINGNPTEAEEVINNALAKVPALSQFLGKYLGDRPALQLASATTKAVAIAKLGLYNVSSALINGTQLINAYAKLGEKWTAEGLRRAAMVGGKNLARKAAGQDIGGASKDIGLLKQMGLDVAMGIESGAGYSRAGMGSFFNASTVMFHKTDIFLRRATGLGAYYKGVSRGMSHKQAIAYAKKLIDQTQFDYSIADTPAFIRRSGPVGQVLFQFKKFPVKQLEFMTRLKGAEKPRFWIPFVLLAGYYGLPGVEPLKNTVKAMFDIDIELETKKYLMEWAGDVPEKKAIAKTIMYGILSNIGPGVDVSRRVGGGDFIPGELRDLSGPTVSTVVSTAQLAAKREWIEALRAISPSPGNLTLALKADGEITDPWNRGRLKIKLTPAERAVKGVGFSPVRESIERDLTSIVGYSESRTRDEETRAIDAFIDAVNSNDDAKITAAAVKLSELRITPERIRNEMRNKLLTKPERALQNVPKKRKAEYTQLHEFTE